MRHSAHRPAFITPRPLLMLANRWIDRQARGVRGGLSFIPLALVFRRARDPNTKPITLSVPGKPDGAEFVVTPRLVFNLHLYHTAATACGQQGFPAASGLRRERPAAAVSFRDGTRPSWQRKLVFLNSCNVAAHLARGHNRQLQSAKRSELQTSRMNQPDRRRLRLFSNTRPWDRVRTVLYPAPAYPEPVRTRTHSLRVLRGHIDTSKPFESSASGHFQRSTEHVSGMHKAQGKSAMEEASMPVLTSARPFVSRLARRMSGHDVVVIDNSRAFQHYGQAAPVGHTCLPVLPHGARSTGHPGSERHASGPGFKPLSIAVLPDRHNRDDASSKKAVRVEHSVMPVQTVHRQIRAVLAQTPPSPNVNPAPSPQAPQVDIARLTDEVWRQLDKRIRIERQRRGRL